MNATNDSVWPNVRFRPATSPAPAAAAQTAPGAAVVDPPGNMLDGCDAMLVDVIRCWAKLDENIRHHIHAKALAQSAPVWRPE